MDSYSFNRLPFFFLPPLSLSHTHTHTHTCTRDTHALEWNMRQGTKPLVEFASPSLGWRPAGRRKGKAGAARPTKRLSDRVPVSPALSREA